MMGLSVMSMLGLLSSVHIAHIAQAYMVMVNAFSSWEAVSQIEVIIWDKRPPLGSEMCL
jgi:hypothetical protein